MKDNFTFYTFKAYDFYFFTLDTTNEFADSLCVRCIRHIFIRF